MMASLAYDLPMQLFKFANLIYSESYTLASQHLRHLISLSLFQE